MNPRPILYNCKDCGSKLSNINQRGGKQKERCDDCKAKHGHKRSKDWYAIRKLDSVRYQRYRMCQRRNYIVKQVPRLEQKIISFKREIQEINQTLTNKPTPLNILVES